MENRHILIVDDEPKVAFFLAKSLAHANHAYRVSSAHSGEEGLSINERVQVDLLITDLRMPGMDGLELMKQFRERNPHCRLILMTAYGNAEIEAMAYRLGACRYITKPFSLEQMIETVEAALADPEMPGRDILVLSDERFESIAQCLADLRFEVGAQCIILADVSGPVVVHVGETDDLDVSTLVSLAGGSFASTFEMARCLGERHALNLNYHEGEKYDVYSSNVNADLFLMLVFNKRVQRSRIGMVWLYIQRILQKLQDLVSEAERISADEVLDADFESQLSDSLDALFASDVEFGSDDLGLGGGLEEMAQPLPESSPPPAAQPEKSPEPAPSPAQPPEPERSPEPSIAPASSEDEAAEQIRETFSLEEALKMGLVDLPWQQDEAQEEVEEPAE